MLRLLSDIIPMLIYILDEGLGCYLQCGVVGFL